MEKIFAALGILVATIGGWFNPHADKVVGNATSSAATEIHATTTLNRDEGRGVERKNTSTDADLLALADNKYANGGVPIGDYKYVTAPAAPKVGYVYLCNVHKDNPGSMVNGPWIHGATWNPNEKISISGSVSWPKATFSNVIINAARTLTGNGLPISHNTGTFPVASSDAAAAYDKNPNTISVQKLSQKLPISPVYLDVPSCMGGEVGVMLSGVPLFNAFDAGLRDAQAHEVQDACEGHPQGSGEYHYHGISSCWKDESVKTTLGYALDGFPITGGKVADGKYLTTEDLDVCHGITSSIIVDGKSVTTYHYVMTVDFPYSVSCFRGKPVSMQVISGGQPMMGQTGQSGQQGNQAQMNQAGAPGEPPQAAVSACSGKSSGDSCSFVGGRGEAVSGTCGAPPGQQTLVCMPR